MPPAKEETSKELARNKVRKTDNELQLNKTRLKAEVRQRSQLNASKLHEKGKERKTSAVQRVFKVLVKGTCRQIKEMYFY